MTIRVAITGATGKLGSFARDLVAESDEFELTAALNSRSDLDEMLGADVLLDVTTPDASAHLVRFALDHDLNVLVGTSGWSSQRLSELEKDLAARPERGVVVIPNFSVGSVLATSFAAAAARFYDSIEIIEGHRASKVDSPSGTAVRTAELIGAARGDDNPVHAPNADQPARGQQVSAVPIHSLRMDGIVAHQQVLLGGPGETVTIAHDTISSDAYRAGIVLSLRAATRATGLTVGLEHIIDLTGPGV